jgi:addiction module HigA family antidote
MTVNPLTAGLRPVHPGELLREDVLPALGLPKAQIARLLYDILNEHQPVTAGMALRIGKLCGDGPMPWLAMQQLYDVKVAERDLGDAIAAIPTLAAA